MLISIIIFFSIPNTEGVVEGPVISLKGRSLMPYCHFEIDDSDYLRSARRDTDALSLAGALLNTVLDPNVTKVIEFHSIGVNVRNVKRFTIINPTDSDYKVQWTRLEPSTQKRHSQFTLLTPTSTVCSGLKSEVRKLISYFCSFFTLRFLYIIQ